MKTLTIVFSEKNYRKIVSNQKTQHLKNRSDSVNTLLDRINLSKGGKKK